MKKTVRKSAGTVRTDTDTLDRLLLDFKKNGKARVHVGVLGGHTIRTEGAMSNADLGAAHEFGVDGGYLNHASSARRKKLAGPNHSDNHLPARSWLRMPVLSHMPDEIKRTGRAVWQAAVVKRGVRGALDLLGVFALRSIQMAFATGGFGAWEALKAATVRRKRAKGRGAGAVAILIDSAQFRQSVTAEVVSK